MRADVRVKFINWKKWQGDGTNYKKTSWFKIDNRICAHRLWDELSPAQFKCFILLLSLASQKDPRFGQVDINFRSLRRMFSARSNTVLATLLRLRFLGVVEYQEVTEAYGQCTGPRLEEKRIDKNRDAVHDGGFLGFNSTPKLEPDSPPYLQTDPPEEEKNTATEELARLKIKPSALQTWTRLYRDPRWVEENVLLAIAHWDVVGSKVPNDKAAPFIARWLQRASAKYIAPTRRVEYEVEESEQIQ